MVYKQMFRASFYQILGVSPRIYADASRFLKSDGVYKIVLESGSTGHENRVYAVKVVDRVAAFIKDVNICMTSEQSQHGRSYSVPRSYGPMQTCRRTDIPRFSVYERLRDCLSNTRSIPLPFRQFAGPFIHRDSCHVAVKTNAAYPSSHSTVELQTMLREFTGFAHLTVVYEPQKTVYHAEQGSNYTDEKGRMKIYDRFKYSLRLKLGPATAVDGDKELRKGIEFFPLKYHEEMSRMEDRIEKARVEFSCMEERNNEICAELRCMVKEERIEKTRTHLSRWQREELLIKARDELTRLENEYCQSVKG